MKRFLILSLVAVMMVFGTTAFAESIVEDAVKGETSHTSIVVEPTVVVYSPGQIDFTVTEDDTDVVLGFVPTGDEGIYELYDDGGNTRVIFTLRNDSTTGTSPAYHWFDGELQVTISGAFIADEESGGSTFNGVTLSPAEPQVIEMSADSEENVSIGFEQDGTASDVENDSNAYDVTVTFSVRPMSNVIE